MSHVFPPAVAGGATRMGQFARLLPDFGWDVTIVTANHGPAALDTATEAEIARRATIITSWSPSTKLVKRGRPVHKRGLRGAARRIGRAAATSILFPDREIFWVPGAIRAGRAALEQENHDVVVATYGPASNLLVGRALAAGAGLPLVIDFRDLWSTLPMPVFPSSLHRAAAAKLEHSLVRAASRLIAVAPAMAQDLASTHDFDAERAYSITNGFDPSDAARVRDVRPTDPRPFRLMYSGTVHIHYNLTPFWRVLRSLADSGTISPESFRVEFVGNLATSELHAFGLEPFVEVRPMVPHDQVFAELARADALLVVETPGYYARYGYAAKVFDYVLTGKPVVALVDAGGNTDKLLRALGVGYCTTPDDTAGLERSLRSVLALKSAKPRSVDIDTPPLRDFNRRHLVAKLAEVLEDVASENQERTAS